MSATPRTVPLPVRASDERLRATVLKLGGELLEAPDRLRTLAAAVAALAADGPLVVVHGGGREIDADLARRGLSKLAVDGIRVTDAPTLDAVVAVLAGTVNTRLVAALVAHRVAAVGLTGADAGCAPATKAPLHRSTGGARVDLGLVGEPLESHSPQLITDLLALGYVPVVASVGLGPEGQLFNVNADTLAASLARRLRAQRLFIGGVSPGVLGPGAAPLTTIGTDMVASLVQAGTATNGMVAKLVACRAAVEGGVDDVRIIGAVGAARLDDAPGTRVIRAGDARVPVPGSHIDVPTYGPAGSGERT